MPVSYLAFGAKGIICLSGHDDDFANGYQAGSLTYERENYTVQHTDATITTLLVTTLENIDQSDGFSAGFVVGWLSGLGERGIKEAPDVTSQPPHPTPTPETQERDGQRDLGESHET